MFISIRPSECSKIATSLLESLFIESVDNVSGSVPSPTTLLKVPLFILNSLTLIFSYKC
jgi:hypothetical protein